MSDLKGKLFTLVAFDPDGNPVALRFNASGELMAVISGGAGSGTTLVPKGELITPVGFDPDGNPVALGADANSQLKIALIGGSANEIIKSDGTDGEWDALADVIKAAILTTVGDIMIVNAGGVVTRLPKPAVGQILGESSQIPAWITKPTGGLTVIEDILLTEATASFDFQNIPATYSHLELVGHLRSSVGSNNDIVKLRFNNDDSAIYDYIQSEIRHSATIGTEQGINATFIQLARMAGNTSPANSFDTIILYVSHYANTTNHKSVRSSAALKTGTPSGSYSIRDSAGWWRSTSAIERMTTFPAVGPNWMAGSRMTLYGLP